MLAMPAEVAASGQPGCTTVVDELPASCWREPWSCWRGHAAVAASGQPARATVVDELQATGTTVVEPSTTA